jgi:hypothetical protein
MVEYSSSRYIRDLGERLIPLTPDENENWLLMFEMEVACWPAVSQLTYVTLFAPGANYFGVASPCLGLAGQMLTERG